MKEKVKNIVLIIAVVIIAGFVVFVTVPMFWNEDIGNKVEENEKLEFVGDKVEEIAQQRVEEEIKKQLKNPNSLSIHSIKVSSYVITNDEGKWEFCNTQRELKNLLARITNNKEYTIHYDIDYSAQNGFGGMNRKTISASITIRDKGNDITSSTPYINFDDIPYNWLK